MNPQDMLSEADNGASRIQAPSVPAPTSAPPLGPLFPMPVDLGALLRELKAIRKTLEMQANGPPELLAAGDAARLLGLSRSTFFRLVAADKLPRPIRFGEQIRRWSRRALLDAALK
jgi:predicted DNA-binding transcriptional regulator AlpA